MPSPLAAYAFVYWAVAYRAFFHYIIIYQTMKIFLQSEELQIVLPLSMTFLPEAALSCYFYDL